jgi:hypothetical protein
MFAVVGEGNLLFSVELPNLIPDITTDKAYLFQFILYASLDNLDLKEATAFRECIDSYDNYTVSAYVTPGQTAFLLLHPKKKELKKFFQQVHGVYAQLLMNPFYDVRAPIEDDKFKQAVIQAAKDFIS